MTCKHCNNIEQIIRHYWSDHVPAAIAAHNHQPEYYRLGYMQGRLDLVVELMGFLKGKNKCCDCHSKCCEEPCEVVNPEEAGKGKDPCQPPKGKTRRDC